VAGTLGLGFLEKVYENALAHELRKAGLGIEQQRGIIVMYDRVMVGEYFVDLEQTPKRLNRCLTRRVAA
jgi:GxxExxY protein